MCGPTAGAIETGEGVQTLACDGKRTDRSHALRTTFGPETSPNAHAQFVGAGGRSWGHDFGR